ncbi:hypothetical protein Tco_0956460, partial [Tanacetum coccineum]
AVALTTFSFRMALIDKAPVLQMQHQVPDRFEIPHFESEEDPRSPMETLQEKSRTVIQKGLSLGVDIRRRGARVFIIFSFLVHVYTVLKPHCWTITLVVSQTSTLITGESSLIPSSGRCPTISGYVAKLLAISALYSAWSIMVKFALVHRGRDPAYAFLLIGQVICALGTLCPLFCWIELPLWLPSYFLLLLAFSVTFGDTDGDSDDEGSAATNSIMHASADGDRGVWC